jgi:hypothetical protein
MTLLEIITGIVTLATLRSLPWETRDVFRIFYHLSYIYSPSPAAVFKTNTS